MSSVLLALGIAVLSAVVVDVFATVVRPDGSGVIASGAAGFVWRIGRRIHDRRPSHGLLATTGVAAVVTLPLTWMAVMWLGWSLVFHGSPDAVLDGSTKLPADGWARIYYAGFSLFTSGLGDQIPGGPPWQMATVVASAMGLGLVTLAITFLVPVLQAANARRAVAQQISDLGHTTTGIVERHEEHDYATLAELAASLPAALTKLSIEHRSYPVLGHLHSPDERTAFAPRLAALHDACVVAAAATSGVRRAKLGAVVDAARDTARRVAPDARTSAPPPIPQCAHDHPGAAEALSDVRSIRCDLRSSVEEDGWDWSCVDGAGGDDA